MKFARHFSPVLFLILVLAISCRTSEPVFQEEQLPAYSARGGKLFVFEPARLPNVLERINLKDLSYAGAYHLFYFKKDTLWKQQRALYQSRTALNVVEEELKPVVTITENGNLTAPYPNSIFAYLRNPGFFRVSDAQFRDQVDQLLLEAPQEFQLFLETYTNTNESHGLFTAIEVYVFNTRKNTLAYQDVLQFDLDFRDTQTFRTALKFMLERLKENSVPPGHTPSGQNRR